MLHIEINQVNIFLSILKTRFKINARSNQSFQTKIPSNVNWHFWKIYN